MGKLGFEVNCIICLLLSGRSLWMVGRSDSYVEFGVI
jgi:hypothetical protein